MSDATLFEEARAALLVTAGRFIDLVRAQPDTSVRIPCSDWSVREASAHLIAANSLYSGIAMGTPSPVASLDKKYAADFAAGRIADIPISEPDELASILGEGLESFLDVTVGRPGNQEIVFHAGLPFDLESVVCVALGEYLLHGYDIASAGGYPWPISTSDALLVLHAYGPLYALCVNPETTDGLNAVFRVLLRGVEPTTFRFVDGSYRVEDDQTVPADCTISADPVAFLMVGTGRLSQSAAVALGLFEASGQRPELARGFSDLFIYP
jgi:hypothetical protein